MSEYRKIATIRATQWFKPGDHPAVMLKSDPHRYADDGIPWIETLEGGHIVTPGDWIATGVKGEHWPIKPDIFAATYEPVVNHPPTTNPVVDHETGNMSDKIRDAAEVWWSAHAKYQSLTTFNDGDGEQAAAAIIEAYAKEREAAKAAALVAEIVADLRVDAGLCDCFARSEGECACGAWSDYKTKPVEQIADYIEAKWGKQ